MLAADLDWGVDLRAEALIARQVVGNKYQHSGHRQQASLVPRSPPRRLHGARRRRGRPGAGGRRQAGGYKVKMPSCYPYTNPVKYHVTWTGNASPARDVIMSVAIGSGHLLVRSDEGAADHIRVAGRRQLRGERGARERRPSTHVLTSAENEPSRGHGDQMTPATPQETI